MRIDKVNAGFNEKVTKFNKKILIVSGSPKKNGNTALLVDWFTQGAKSKGAKVEIVNAAFLKYKANGCTSYRLY